MSDVESKKEFADKSLLIFRSDIKKLRLHLVASGVSLFILTLAVVFIGDGLLYSYIRESAKSNPVFYEIMKYISGFGNYVFYSIFFAIGIYGFFMRKYFLIFYALVYLLIQIVASIILVRFLKFTIGRMRPNNLRHDAFPSGHTADMAVSASALSYFLRVYLLRIISYFCIALMGLSRIAVGSHYPLDVIGGAFVGLFSSYIIFHIYIISYAKYFKK